MKNIHRKWFLSVALVAVLGLVGCNDDWSQHYDREEMELVDTDLIGYISSQADLQTFYKMLQKTGYDTVLNASQAYTVWAPNNDALTGVNTDDLVEVEKIVKNHIARSSMPTSGIQSKSVSMMNGKYVTFERVSDGFAFGHVAIAKANVAAKNGIVHVLSGYVPYYFNLWEYIEATTGLDSLRTFLGMWGANVIDLDNSVQISTDTAGNIIYDTVFVYKNTALELLGNMNVEDSTYSAVLPTNVAWNEAYARVKGFYNIPNLYGGANRQTQYVKWALVNDLVFRGKVFQPESLDSLVSTTQNVFYNPAYLFQGSQQVELSNGLGYVTDKLNYIDTTSWFKPIKVEAESSVGRSSVNATLYSKRNSDPGIEVSNDRYISLDPFGTSDATKAAVTFSIPNALSAKYNIYCVFVPAKVATPTNLLPTKVSFKLVYVRSTGGITGFKTFTPANNVVATDIITKMYVGQFTFPYADVQDKEFDEVNVTLDVVNAVKLDEKESFQRGMAIDYILLEPVR